jgi:enoyl-CoA hydratase/carnithine racemase
MPESLVLRSDAGGVATLTLNRPEALNALSPNLFVALRTHVDAIAQEPDTVGVVVVRAAGRAFSAGADLKAMQRGEVAPAPNFQSDTLTAIEALPQPVLFAVHGFCFTGAMELMLAGDLCIATESAVFADTHGRWGMVPGWGLCQRLERRIGLLKAKELSYTRRRISAAEAKEIGLINAVVPDNGLDDAIGKLTSEILETSWHSLRGYKFFYNRGRDYTFNDGLAFERREHPGRAPDLKDRIATFGQSS